jgi:hypothetical protein
VTPIAKALLVAWINVCAAYWGADPALCLAVAHIESRVPGKWEFRVGKVGKSFYGPFCIHEGYLKQPIKGVVYPIDEWPINVWVGCRAFRGIRTRAGARRRLKSYNATFDEVYWRAVKKAWRRYSDG